MIIIDKYLIIIWLLSTDISSLFYFYSQISNHYMMIIVKYLIIVWLSTISDHHIIIIDEYLIIIWLLSIDILSLYDYYW